MRLLANENFPGLAITALRSHRHDVVWIREDSPGISDHNALSRATAEGRILMTFDKDFGELVFRLGTQRTFGDYSVSHSTRFTIVRCPDSGDCVGKSDGLGRTLLCC